jgi:HD-GYP domain-containing protein (c-di-GMP phosphodiesterase class II)
MTSDRPYRSALSHEEAVAELIRCAGSQFDPRLVMHFLDVLEEERKDGLQPAEVGAFLPSQYQQLFSLIF